MICPGCGLETTVDGRCITLGCKYYVFPEFWQVQQEEQIPIEEGNHFA